MLFLLVILAAFLGQSIAVQSHVHPAGVNAGLAFQTWTKADAKLHISGGGVVDSTADCPLCAEFAAGGSYLASGPILIPEAIPPVLWLFALPVAAILCRTRSHRWQSRAPPQ